MSKNFAELRARNAHAKECGRLHRQLARYFTPEVSPSDPLGYLFMNTLDHYHFQGCDMDASEKALGQVRSMIGTQRDQLFPDDPRSPDELVDMMRASTGAVPVHRDQALVFLTLANGAWKLRDTIGRPRWMAYLHSLLPLI